MMSVLHLLLALLLVLVLEVEMGTSASGVEFQVDTTIEPNTLLYTEGTLAAETMKRVQDELAGVTFMYAGSTDASSRGRRPRIIQSGAKRVSAFYETVSLAWFNHYPLSLSPDHIWTAIIQGFAKHINENPEKYRDQFVQHEGQEKVEVVVGSDPRTEADWDNILAAFEQGIAAHIGPATSQLLQADFSTTGTLEKSVTSIALMDAMQSFFKYEIAGACGIPKIFLDGTPDDWRRLRAKTAALAQYDLEWWTMHLLPVLDQFIAASEGDVNRSFWESIFSLISGAYVLNPQVNGWFITFFPYLDFGTSGVKRNSYLGRWEWDTVKRGILTPIFGGGASLQCSVWQSGVQPGAFGIGLSSAPFLFTGELALSGAEMRLVGGFVGIQQDPETLALSPYLGYACGFEKGVPIAESHRQFLWREDNALLNPGNDDGGIGMPASPVNTCFDGVKSMNPGSDGIPVAEEGVDCGEAAGCRPCGCVSIRNTGTDLDGQYFHVEPMFPFYATYWNGLQGSDVRLMICHECEESIRDRWHLVKGIWPDKEILFVADGDAGPRFGLPTLFGSYRRFSYSAAGLQTSVSLSPSDAYPNTIEALSSCEQYLAELPRCIQVAATPGSQHSTFAKWSAADGSNGGSDGSTSPRPVGQVAFDQMDASQQYRRIDEGVEPYYGVYAGVTDDSYVIRISGFIEPQHHWHLIRHQKTPLGAVASSSSDIGVPPGEGGKIFQDSVTGQTVRETMHFIAEQGGASGLFGVDSHLLHPVTQQSLNVRVWVCDAPNGTGGTSTSGGDNGGDETDITAVPFPDIHISTQRFQTDAGVVIPAPDIDVNGDGEVDPIGRFLPQGCGDRDDGTCANVCRDGGLDRFSQRPTHICCNGWCYLRPSPPPTPTPVHWYECADDDEVCRECVVSATFHCMAQCARDATNVTPAQVSTCETACRVTGEARQFDWSCQNLSTQVTVSCQETTCRTGDDSCVQCCENLQSTIIQQCLYPVRDGEEEDSYVVPCTRVVARVTCIAPPPPSSSPTPTPIPTQSSTSTPSPPSIAGCPHNGVVSCLGDPCEGTTCSAVPDATCSQSDCHCDPVFTDATGVVVDDCTNGVPVDGVVDIGASVAFHPTSRILVGIIVVVVTLICRWM